MSNKVTAIQDIEKALDSLNGKLLVSDEIVLKLSGDAHQAFKAFQNIKTPKDVAPKIKKAAEVTEQLNAQVKIQDKLEKNLITTIEKKVMVTEATSRALEKEKFELREVNRNVREAAKLSSALATEYQKESIRLNQLIRRRQDLAVRQKVSNDLSKKERAELVRLTRAIEKKDRALKAVDAQVGRYQRNVGNYAIAMRSASAAARSMASALGVVGGAALFVRVMRDAIGTVREFEKQNATLSAVLQVERSEMKALTEDSVRLGSETVKTANEVTGLQIAYARLGFTQKDILALTEATIQGSIAMNSELSETAELVGAVVNTFEDLTTTDAPEIIDIMSLATAKSALNFSKLQTGIPIVAGAANAAGIPFTKLVALLGKLADSGIDVSSSATSLRNIFIESAAQGDSYEKILKKIKGSQDKLTASNDEFGKRAAVSASVLSDNIDKTNELDEALQNAAGTAETMANKELDTLDGSLQLLRSAWEGYILELNEATGSSNNLREMVGFLAKNLKDIIRVLWTAVKVYAAYKVAVQLARLQQYLMNQQLLLSTKATAAGTAGVGRMTVAWRSFSRVLKANALGIVIGLLWGLYEVFEALNVSMTDTAAELNKVSQEFTTQALAAEKINVELLDMVGRYEELTKKTKLNKDEQKELNEIIKKLAKNVPSAVTEIDKYGDALGINTGKVKEFITQQREINKLQAEINLGKLKDSQKELGDEQKRLNLLTKEGNAVRVQGIGLVENQDGVLKKVTTSFTKGGQAIFSYTTLTKNQMLEYKKYVQSVEQGLETTNKEIEANEDVIASVTGVKNARQKEVETATEAAKEKEENLKKQEDEILVVQRLKKEISELETLLKTLTKNGYDSLTAAQAEQVKSTRKLIGEKKKELASITGVSEKRKQETKALKGTIQYYENLIKVFKTQQKTLAKTSKEYDYFQDRINTLQKGIDLLSGKDISIGVSVGINSDDFDLKKIVDKNLKEIRNHMIARGMEDLSDVLGKNVEDLYQEYFDQYGADFSKFFEFIEKKLEDHTTKITKFKEDMLTGSANALASSLGVEAGAMRNFLDGIINDFDSTSEAVLSSLSVAAQVTSAVIAQAAEASVQRYDHALEENRNFYDKLLENEKLTDEEREKLQDARDQKEAELNRKKKEKQRQAAIFNKILSIAEIGINTALSVTKTAATLGYPAAIPFVALAIAQGAIQAGVVAATPIPQFYKGKGDLDKYEGPATWGEVKREIRFGRRGVELSPRYPGLHKTHVFSDDVIHPDADAFLKNYNDLLRANSISGSMERSNDDASILIASGLFRRDGLSTDRIVRAIERNKSQLKVYNNLSLGEDFKYANRGDF